MRDKNTNIQISGISQEKKKQTNIGEKMKARDRNPQIRHITMN